MAMTCAYRAGSGGLVRRVGACAAMVVLAIGFIAACTSARAHGARAARAEILWDVWGVPHIFARSGEDLFYALGWATMRNHGALVLRHYGQARGRAAEYWGPPYFESDAQVRTLRIPARAERALARQTPSFRRKLDAFASGVNAFAVAHPDSIPEDVRVVLPISAADLLAHQQRSGVLPFAFAALREDVERWRGQLGSNAWAIGPSHAANGRAMLLMNPHIPWDEAVFGGLFRVFEVDLKSPGLDFYGPVQVGNPFPSGGFNNRLGFTHTVNTLDDVDVYELTIRDGGYVLDGAVRAFEEETGAIRVRLENGAFEERPLRVRWSIHGPVIAEREGHALAVRLAGIDLPLQSQQFWDMARARNFGEFRNAARRLQIPKSNLLYADAAGNIFYLAGGAIPARAQGDYGFWGGLVPGDSSRTLWTRTLAFASLPQTLNPPAGWVQNANDPPWSVTDPPTFGPDQFPPWMSPRALSFRTQRSLRMISEGNRLDFDALRRAKLSTRSELADRVLDDLIAAARARGGERLLRAADTLAAWDRCADAESRGAILFFAWAQRFLREPNAWRTPQSFDDFARSRATPSGLADPARAAVLLDEAAADIIVRRGALDVAFGEVYRLRSSGGIDLPANGASGQYGVFRVVDYLPDADGRMRAFSGDSFVALVEFTNPVRAEVLLSYGNASTAGSPHNGDQLQLFSEKRLRSVWRDRAGIEAHLEMRETLP